MERVIKKSQKRTRNKMKTEEFRTARNPKTDTEEIKECERTTGEGEIVQIDTGITQGLTIEIYLYKNE